jgi:predicted Zn-dependent peptidase
MLSSVCSSNSLSVNNLRRLTSLLAGAARRPSFPDSTDVTESAIVREVLPNGLRLLTERMPQVRSVSIGVWLARGSRHEPQERGGIAHFVEHMLFKGTGTRTAEDIAQAIDSVGGQMDAFTAKEYASYYIKVLDEHLAFALEVLSDIVMNPRFSADDIEREKKVVLEEIKMVEDTPDDLVHELFTENFWADHPLGRPILGTKETVESLDAEALTRYFRGAYTAPHLIVAAVGNVDHARVRDLVARTFAALPTETTPVAEAPPRVVPCTIIRNKELEQSHVCLGTAGYRQDHKDRYSSYVMNTVLGGSMSSRLFQNVREKRGLAYAVFSGLSAYRDTGSMTIYAGCANDAVGELIDVVIGELRRMKEEPLPDAELRRAKDHLKGSLMLNLESTSSRMSHIARQEIYFDRQFGLDETLEGVERVTPDDIQRVARDLFASDALAATVLGAVNGLQISRERLWLG